MSSDGGVLDTLLASASSPVTKAPVNSDALDLNLDDLLGPPPQRFSGGGVKTNRGGWDEEDYGQGYGGGGGRSSYDGEFGAARGKFASDVNGANEKAVKGDRLLKQVDVDDDGACPVAEKDVDPKTVQSLASRGIENFTPVQVSVETSLVGFRCRALG